MSSSRRIQLKLRLIGWGLAMLLILTLAFSTAPASASIEPAEEPAEVLILEQLPSFYEFAADLPQAHASVVVGVYAPGRFALRVVQQPATHPGFVSTLPGTATQFRAAGKYGTLGLLAHNTHAGSNFFRLLEGDLVIIIYGDGRHARYQVADIRRFQALTPTSPYSNFRDLDNGSTPLLTSTGLFHQTYGVGGQTILQTCIERDGNLVWGRLFIIADPAPVQFDHLAVVRPPI